MARSGVVYGPTKSFKTSQIKWFAHYIAELTGKSTLLLSLDGGGWAPCQPEVDAGMIRPYRCEVNVLPLTILRKISQGYWPSDPSETEPSRINLVPINWQEVGAVAFEGWTSAGVCISRYLADKGISVGGEDRTRNNMMFSLPITVNEAVVQENFGSTTRGDYKFIQNMLNGLVMNFNSLPCEYVLYTALESKTEDDDRSTIYGPAIEGKKGTAQCGAWVGDLIHAQDYQVPRQVQVPNPAGGDPVMQTVFDITVRYFFKKHPDPSTGILFPAGTRCPPEKIGELAKVYPGGYFEPQADGRHSLGEYLKLVDQLAGQQADSLRGWREKADKMLGRKS